jgi:arylsulfatase A-like enzyme
MSSEQTTHREPGVMKSIYWALLGAVVLGSAFAFYETWYRHHYIQKSLSNFVLEIFARRTFQVFCGLATVLLVLLPGVAFVDSKIKGLAGKSNLRFSFIVIGFVGLCAAYTLNKTEWYPPFSTPAGLASNAGFGVFCLVLAIVAARLLDKVNLSLPVPFKGGLTRLYNPFILALLAVAFLGYNSYVYFTIMNRTPDRPNVVIISIDTLRADHLGCYGYERNTSPVIDKLATEGTLFERMYSQMGLTWPSLTSIMTSLYPKTHGVRHIGTQLEPEFTTLAEILKNEGYKTGAFLANFYWAPNRGFDEKKGGEVGNLDRSVTDYALNFLRGIDPESDRFFMWLHMKNPHVPYKAPEPFHGMFDSTYTGQIDGSQRTVYGIYADRVDLTERELHHLLALYDEEIRSSDAFMEEVLDKLAAMGVDNNTLVIFTSDHGEELYDRNYYFDHTCSIYEGVLRIPFIIKFPGIIEAGRRVVNQVQSIDIMPTILDLLKLPVAPELEGASLLSILVDKESEEWHPVFSDRSTIVHAIRTPEWKYIYNPENYHYECVPHERDKGDGYIIKTQELYNVVEDPYEMNDVADRHPEVVQELRARVIHWLKTNERSHKDFQLSDAAEKRLRALGYVK